MFSVPVDRPIVCPVLVGRAAFVEAIERALGSICDAGQTIVLAGAAGIGKSRLVAEARALAAGRGLLHLEGRCFEPDRALPFAPLIDLLRTRMLTWPADTAAAELGPTAPLLVKLVPELADRVPGLAPAPTLDPEEEKRRLLSALAEYVTRQASATPLLVVVEDLHWSDDVSLEFLLGLVRRLRLLPVLLLLTCRDDEPNRGLAHFLAELDRGRLATELSLRPLSKTDVDQMVRAILPIDRGVQAEFLDELYALTEGNPFFVEEVLKSLVTAGQIVDQHGRWSRQSVQNVRIPRTIEDAVRRRVERLSAPARQAVVIAAVMGQRFSFGLLQELTGRGEHELLSQIKEAIVAQVLVEASADQFAFRHALTRRAIYTELLGRERRQLHHQIAEAIERTTGGTSRTDLPTGALRTAHEPSHLLLADLAYHSFEAASWDRAFEYARAAGARAQSMHAPSAAVEHFTRAIEAAGAAQGMEVPSDLYRTRGLAYETLGEFELALADHEAALRAARAVADRSEEWQALLALGLLWAWRDYAQTGRYFNWALELARHLGDRRTLALSLNRVGNWYVNVDRPLEARQYHQAALAEFEVLADPHGIAETLDLLGLVSFNTGAMSQGVTYYERAIALFRELDDRRGLVFDLSTLAQRGAYYAIGIGWPTRESDGVAACTRQAEQAVSIAQEIGWRAGEVLGLTSLAGCLASEGAYARAFAAARSGLAIADEIEHRLWICVSHLMFGEIYLDLLAFPLADRHLRRALALAEEVGSLMFRRLATALLAQTTLMQGEPARADDLLDTVLAPDVPVESRALHWCSMVRAEVALVRGDPARALAILDALATAGGDRPPAWVEPRASVVRGAALMLLGRPSEAETALLAAHQQVRAEHARSQVWRTHTALARFYLARRRTAEARQELGAARAIVEGLAENVPDEPSTEPGGVRLREQFRRAALDSLPRTRPPTPLRTAKEASGGLTARERQVAALIATGKSNREIAEALTVGETTVESHVSNILGKLGFGSRAQVAAWAVEKRLTGSDG